MPVKRSQNTRLSAKNTRLVDTALRTMDNLLDANRQNVANAIEATGFPVTIYNRLQSGRRCTCTSHRRELINAEGHLGAGVIDQLVTGTENGIGGYGDDDDHQQEWDQGRTQIVDAFHPNSKPDISSTSINLIGGLGDPEGLDGDDSGMPVDVDLSDDEDGPKRLYIGNNTSCGVCFGTTFVGGYDLLYGSRHICDTTLTHTIELGELDAVSAPNKFGVYEGGHVTFDVLFPARIPFVLYPRVFDNKAEVPPSQFVLECSANGGNTWVEVTPETVHALCIGLPGWVRISPAQGVNRLSFTHIEFLFSTRDRANPPKADFPEVNKAMILTLADALSSSTIIMPGDILLNRGSIIIDHLPGLSRHWMTGQITPRRDQRGNVYDTSAEGRVMDLNELGQLLRPLMQYREPLV